MLMYEFKCPNCGVTKEVSAEDAAAAEADELSTLLHCEDDGAALKRVYSLSGIAFKGSGFFRTDNK